MSQVPADYVQEIEAINQRLQALEHEKSQLLTRKAELEAYSASRVATSSTLSLHDKVALFQKFFVGRSDIYAFRWENSSGKSGYAVADSKDKVAIYDYVDSALPMLQRMFQRRCKGYEAMGYILVNNDASAPAVQSTLAV